MPNIIAAIQMTSSMNVQENLRVAEKLIEEAAQAGACLVVLPENFSMLGKGPEYREAKIKAQEKLGEGLVQDFLAAQAQKNSIWIIGGTIPIASDNPQKCYASALVYDDKGKQIAQYNKINLFDVKLNEQELYQESKTIMAGEKSVVIDSPGGKLGLAICFDVRFPELFRGMAKQGVEIFALPSAFTVATGTAHWDILTRAIAVQNFAYVIAAAQVGEHGMGRKTYGHSRIIDPNGEILSELSGGAGVMTAAVDLNLIKELRHKIPSLL